MIQITNLKVNVWEKEILKELTLDFKIGKNYLILGKNGSWKSSISNFLMWNPIYEYISWEANIDWININLLSVDERSKAGLFLSFQNIPEIEWVNLWEYLRIIYNNHLKNKNPEIKPISPFVFKRFLKKYLYELEIDERFLSRDLNVWFSGWEKRKIELLQAKLIEPKYIILDEIDSWLDIDAFKIVSHLIWKLDTKDNSIIIITHQFKMIEYINFDMVYILKDGKVSKKWGTELLEEIMEKGFE